MDVQAAPTEDWARTQRMRGVRAAIQSGLMFPALSSFCRLTVNERERLSSLNGPAVFASKPPRERLGHHDRVERADMVITP